MRKMIAMALLFVIVAGLLFVVMNRFAVFIVSAPELFGNGTAYMIHPGNVFLGYIDAWGGWAITQIGNKCWIIQIVGDRIGGAEKPVSCFMSFQNWDRFTGWIDFRGHRRKFCGAGNARNLPMKCYGE